MQIYIRRNNEDFGPYSREAALEYVKQGIFQAYDSACYAGMAEWKTVSELLGISRASEPARGSKRERSTPTAASGKAPTTASGRPQPPREPRIFGPTGEKKRGPMIVLNVVLILIVVAAAYVRFGGGGKTARHFLASISGGIATPDNGNTNVSAAPAPVAAAPVIEKQPAAAEAPAPAPVAASTPAPPKPFDPAALAGNPGAWPKTLKLKQGVTFPAVFNSQVVGSVIKPAGTVVNLKNVVGDQLILEFNGGTQQVSWKLTDLEEEVAKSSFVAPAATAAPEAAPAMGNPPPAGN